MKVLLIILGVLLGIPALILLIPARIRVRYVDKLEVWAGVGPVTLKLIPEKPRKARKSGKVAKKKSDKPKRASKKFSIGKLKYPKLSALVPTKVTLETMLAYAQLIREAMGGMLRTVRIYRLKLHAVVSADDPARAALAYGGAAAAIHTLLPAFERIINWRQAEMVIDVDFSGNAWGTIDISVSVLPIVLLIVTIKTLLKYMEINKHSAQEAAVPAPSAPANGERTVAL